MTRWICPTCHHTVELHITPRIPPTCRHGNTNHDAKRPTQMIEENTDAS